MTTRALPWTEDDPAIADVLGDHDQNVHTYLHKGVCRVPRCGTRLSIYNDGDLCAAHAFDRHIRLPVTKRAHGGNR